MPRATIQRVLLVWLYQMFLASFPSAWLVPVRYLNIRNTSIWHNLQYFIYSIWTANVGGYLFSLFQKWGNRFRDTEWDRFSPRVAQPVRGRGRSHNKGLFCETPSQLSSIFYLCTQDSQEEGGLWDQKVGAGGSGASWGRESRLWCRHWAMRVMRKTHLFPR